MLPMNAPDRLSDSQIAYLFASQFLEPVPPGGQATPSFATGLSVSIRSLAVTLPMVALWSLQRFGYVSLTPFTARRMFVVKTPSVRVRLVRDVEAGGIEGAFLRKLRRSRSAKSEG